ncbi:MAG: hypothetical protein JNL96_16930 [Planctomycetaceae bacterium]|nr:hypothetical protein [Planctomycetaceae bacterium]
MNTDSQNDLANTLDEIVAMNREKNILVVMYELSDDQYAAIGNMLEVTTDDDDGTQREYFHNCLVRTNEVSQRELAAMKATPGTHKGVRYHGLQMSFID